MIIKNTVSTYGIVAKTMHWLIAFLIIFMLIMGATLNSISNDTLQKELIQLHKAIGLLIIGLATLRILWRLMNKQPPLPADMPVWQRSLAHFSHWLLYVLLFILPLSGWLMVSYAGHSSSFFGLFSTRLPVVIDQLKAYAFFNIHKTLAWAMAVLLSLHILAALYHQFVKKDDVFRRMNF